MHKAAERTFSGPKALLCYSTTFGQDECESNLERLLKESASTIVAYSGTDKC